MCPGEMIQDIEQKTMIFAKTAEAEGEPNPIGVTCSLVLYNPR
jgi:hypothetical protein